MGTGAMRERVALAEINLEERVYAGVRSVGRPADDLRAQPGRRRLRPRSRAWSVRPRGRTRSSRPRAARSSVDERARLVRRVKPTDGRDDRHRRRGRPGAPRARRGASRARRAVRDETSRATRRSHPSITVAQGAHAPGSNPAAIERDVRVEHRVLADAIARRSQPGALHFRRRIQRTAASAVMRRHAVRAHGDEVLRRARPVPAVRCAFRDRWAPSALKPRHERVDVRGRRGARASCGIRK